MTQKRTLNRTDGTYSYYESGLVKEECAFSDEGAGFFPTDSLGGPHRKLFLYNEQNKPTVVVLFKANGEFTGLESTRYDRRGNELEASAIWLRWNSKEKTKYVYRFDHFGNPNMQETYEWDAEGHGSYRLREVSHLVIQYRRSRRNRTRLRRLTGGRGDLLIGSQRTKAYSFFLWIKQLGKTVRVSYSAP